MKKLAQKTNQSVFGDWHASNSLLVLVAILVCAAMLTLGYLSIAASAITPKYEQQHALGPSGEPWEQVSIGAGHTCAVDSGSVYCWGMNDFGQVGNGKAERSSTFPAKQAKIGDPGALSGKYVTEVAAGWYHTCALADGEVYCWGANWSGELGDGSFDDSTVPIAVDMSGVLAGKTVTKLSTHRYRTCVVADGQVYCWGDGNYGLLGNGTGDGYYANIPESVDSTGVLAGKVVEDITMGWQHTCVLADAKVYCWGDNAGGRVGSGASSGITSTPVAIDIVTDSGDSDVKSIAAGDGFTCALVGGEVYCWGQNYRKQIGDGTTVDALTPVKVLSNSSFVNQDIGAIGASSYTACASKDGTSLYCWGSNYNGELGTPDAPNPSDPTLIDTKGHQIVAIDGSDDNICMITGEGNLYCWGDNFYGDITEKYGQFEVPSYVDLDILRGKTVSRVLAGENHSCALAEEQIYCWGLNHVGQLGSGSTTGYEFSEPVATDMSGALAGKTVTDISVGTGATCAIASGEAYCWGAGGYGRLGHGSTSNASLPTAIIQDSGVLAGKTITKVAAPVDEHGCAIADGEAYCWGRNHRGQLGNNTFVDSSVPVKVTQAAGVLAGKTVTDISVSGLFTCAIADGEAYCWGAGASGRLGRGSTANSSVPVKVTQAAGVLAGKTVTDISAGYDFACVVADGQAYCWGAGSYGRLGNGATANATTPVAVNSTGELAGKTIQSISAHFGRACVVADGEVYCWGYNYYYGLGLGDRDDRLLPTRVIQEPGVLGGRILSASAELSGGPHSSMLFDNNQIIAWGDNADGELGYDPYNMVWLDSIPDYTVGTTDPVDPGDGDHPDPVTPPADGSSPVGEGSAPEDSEESRDNTVLADTGINLYLLLAGAGLILLAGTWLLRRAVVGSPKI